MANTFRKYVYRWTFDSKIRGCVDWTRIYQTARYLPNRLFCAFLTDHVWQFKVCLAKTYIVYCHTNVENVTISGIWRERKRQERKRKGNERKTQWWKKSTRDVNRHISRTNHEMMIIILSTFAWLLYYLHRFSHFLIRWTL